MINRLFIALFLLLLAVVPIVCWQWINDALIDTRLVSPSPRPITAFRLQQPVFPNETKGLDAKAESEPLRLSVSAQGSAPVAGDEKKNGSGAKPAPRGQQTPEKLWRNWQARLNRAEYQQIPIINALLADSLRKHPDPSVYRSIGALLASPDETVENKALAVDLLAEIATPESLGPLLALVGQETDSPLYFQALQAISRIGENRWDGEFHEELSPVLESAWSNAENNDPAFLSAIGQAIAGVGAPDGVNLLLLTLAASNKDGKKEETERAKQEVAFNAVPQVRNPDAVAVLGEWFEQESLGTPAFEVSATALAEIGSAEATKKLVDWATAAPAEGARNFEDWLTKIDEPNTLATLATTQDLAFASPEVGDVFNRFAVTAGADSARALSKAVTGK